MINSQPENMGDSASSKESKKDFLYSVRLAPEEHYAAEILIDVLKQKGLIKNGVKGKVSRYQLLKYLFYACLDKHKEEVFAIMFPEDNNNKGKSS